MIRILFPYYASGNKIAVKIFIWFGRCLWKIIGILMGFLAEYTALITRKSGMKFHKDWIIHDRQMSSLRDKLIEYEKFELVNEILNECDT